MKTPLVSLIVPMHNAEEFIRECLNSITQQTYQNLEVVIVDDDSKDNSAEIITEYTQKKKNIVYTKVDNRSASKTRRDGVAVATAELVCFVDADDVLDRGYVERLYETMKATKTDIAACNVETFSGKLQTLGGSPHTKPYALESNARSFAKHYHITDTNKLALQTLPCKLFKKSLFDGIDYSVIVTNIFEDNFILAQILRKVKSVGVVDETLYWYRQTAGTISDTTVTTMVEYKGRRLNSIEFFRDVVMEYCREQLPGPDVDAAITQLCAVEFFNYARMVPELLTRKEYLEQRVELDERRLEAKDKEITAIHESKSYKTGKAVHKAATVLKGRRK